jgi:para-nitrobenzyl esterase
MMALVGLGAVAAAAAPAPPAARVTGGTVRGAMQEAPGAVFKGIPFAQPPVGPLRWREPQPVTAWERDRDATRFASACVQGPTGTGAFLQPLARLYGVQYEPGKVGSSEDCLYLNVWTPEWPMRKPAAVMVWLHGGSNVSGSGAERPYDGSGLTSKGVVLVTVNYRLGVMGFFSHPELTRESPREASGNYGLLDQIAALEWVRKNIGQFGGDPGRVTLFGESAGAIDAGLLLTSPLAAGLFQRVILQSGPVLSLAARPASRERGERFGVKVAQAFGDSGQGSLEKLRAVAPGRLMEAVAQVRQSEPDPGIVLDGWCLRESPAAVFAQAKQSPADVMIGNNGREMSAFRAKAEGSKGASPAVGGDALQVLRVFYGRAAMVVAGLFLLDEKLGRNEAADSWLNDALCACPAMATAALHAGAGHRAYVYQFLRSVPGKGEKALGSFHALEIPYVFGSFRQPEFGWLPFEPSDLTLGETMRSYWTNFAKTGDPNGANVPGWPAFDAQSKGSMEFGRRGTGAASTKSVPAFCSVDMPELKQRLQAVVASWR